MQPTGFRTDLFRHRGGESDDVVLYLRLDFLNALHVDISVGADGPGGRMGHDPGLGQRLRGGDFHFEPHAVFVFLTPDPAHGRSGITSDQPKPPVGISTSDGYQSTAAGAAFPKKSRTTPHSTSQRRRGNAL